MKLKKLAIAILTLAMLLSTMAISANAATGDYEDEYFRLDMSRIDYTRFRCKYDNTAVYIKNQEYTLPYNGYYVQTQYGNSQVPKNIYNASTRCKINTYSERIIRSNATSNNLKFSYVRIRGDYLETAYASGWVDIAWSPDTQGTVTSLN